MGGGDGTGTSAWISTPRGTDEGAGTRSPRTARSRWWTTTRGCGAGVWAADKPTRRSGGFGRTDRTSYTTMATTGFEPATISPRSGASAVRRSSQVFPRRRLRSRLSAVIAAVGRLPRLGLDRSRRRRRVPPSPRGSNRSQIDRRYTPTSHPARPRPTRPSTTMALRRTWRRTRRTEPLGKSDAKNSPTRSESPTPTHVRPRSRRPPRPSSRPTCSRPRVQTPTPSTPWRARWKGWCLRVRTDNTAVFGGSVWIRCRGGYEPWRTRSRRRTERRPVPTATSRGAGWITLGAKTRSFRACGCPTRSGRS